MKQIVSIKKNHEFRRAYAKGVTAASPTLVLYCRKNRLPYNRLGLTVSTKVGGAVVRNRVRRRLREVYRANRAGIIPGHDLILVARSRAADARFDQLQRDFRSLVRRLKLTAEREQPR